MMREIAPGVTTDPRVHHGKPVIKGTRVPVEFILGHMAAGMSSAEIGAEYDLSPQNLKDAMRLSESYAISHAISRRNS